MNHHNNSLISENQIRNRDVICSRGNGVLFNPGNIFYANIIKERKQAYQSTKSPDVKKDIAKEIFDTFKKSKPPGRFLKVAQNNNNLTTVGEVYYEEMLHDVAILKKIAQALREKPKSRRSYTSKTNTRSGVSNVVSDISTDSTISTRKRIGKKRRREEQQTEKHCIDYTVSPAVVSPIVSKRKQLKRSKADFSNVPEVSKSTIDNLRLECAFSEKYGVAVVSENELVYNHEISDDVSVMTSEELEVILPLNHDVMVTPDACNEVESICRVSTSDELVDTSNDAKEPFSTYSTVDNLIDIFNEAVAFCSCRPLNYNEVTISTEIFNDETKPCDSHFSWDSTTGMFNDVGSLCDTIDTLSEVEPLYTYPLFDDTILDAIISSDTNVMHEFADDDHLLMESL